MASLNRAQMQAIAEVEARKRRGEWAGGVQPHVEYQDDPIGWMRDKLQIPEHTIRWSLNPGYDEHEWDGDPDPLAQACEALARGQDVGIEAATGTQKTFTAACLVLWFLACFKDSIVSTWAPKEDQLLLHMWKEIGRLWPRFEAHFPDAILLTGKIRMKPADSDGKEVWAATAHVAGVSADEETATKAQGSHAVHMLIITEETPGIHPAIMKALDNTRTADHNLHLALGNPDHRADPLHEFCMRESVVDLRISAFDHPNIVSDELVVPAAIGPRRLQERIDEYGVGSRLYQSRIRGISPSESEEALIRYEWCVLAAKKYGDPKYRVGALGIGADVANSENGDKSAVARFQGSCVTEVSSRRCPDANKFGKFLHSEITDPENPVDPRHVGIDPIGVGAGAVNEMKRLGIKVRHLGGGTRAIPGLDTDTLWSQTETDLEGNLKPSGPVVIDAQRFNNLRSQIWWTLREDLRLGRIALPNDEELFLDLTTPEWGTKNGVIVVERKEEIVKRLGRSPDKGDAVAYGNFVRRRVPVIEQQREELKAHSNRDIGLEKLLIRREKERRARNREARKQLKLVGKALRAGRR